MFDQYDTSILDNSPRDLSDLMNLVWANRPHLADKTRPIGDPKNQPLGHPDHRSDLEPLLPGGDVVDKRLRWHHLIYAYMIENTRIWEIFRRVLHEYLHGEKLGTPLPEAQAWLRTTEALFYSPPVPTEIFSVVSNVRPNDPNNRSDVYQRVLGMSLNHGSDDGKPYPSIKADASNSTFVAAFEEVLREVWVAMTFVTATASANQTDPSKIHALIQKIHDMLLSRRQNGNLSREEFAYVATMSWFHRTINFDSPIVKSMRAEAAGIEQRLFKIAERVGLPAHGLSRSFFDIAQPISHLLIDIEAGVYATVSSVTALYTPPSTVEPEMRTILTHWAAMRDIKVWK